MHQSKEQHIKKKAGFRQDNEREQSNSVGTNGHPHAREESWITTSHHIQEINSGNWCHGRES